jgi:hypothetical protein
MKVQLQRTINKEPVATIQQVTGKDQQIFNDKKIVVEDQTDESVIYLNIPAKVKH